MRRADPSTKAFVRSAARWAASESSSASAVTTTGSKVSSATPRCPSRRYAGSVLLTLADSGVPSVGADHEGASVFDRRSEVERRARQIQVLVHAVGQRPGLVRRQVAPDPAIHDRGSIAGGEVDAVREVAVAHVHADAEGFEDAARRVLVLRRVPQDPEHADVGFGRDPSPTVITVPVRPRRASASRFGVSAASSGVRPSNSGIGSSPSPSRQT